MPTRIRRHLTPPESLAREGGARTSVWRRWIGVWIGLVARVWLASLRVRVVVDPRLDSNDPHGWVLAFWHGAQFPLYAWPRRRKTAALVSLSADGEMLGGAMVVLGLDVVRGSSSRGGARGLRALLGALGDARDVAVAVEGPRGPAHSVHPGAALAARRAGALLVPIAAACDRSVVLSSWDRFELPLPFSRIVVALGAPLDPRTDDVGPSAVHDAIEQTHHTALSLLPPRPARGGVKSQPLRSPSA